jgi:hypothetical protein
MNSTKKILLGLSTSLLLSCGLVRAAEATVALVDPSSFSDLRRGESTAPVSALCGFTEAAVNTAPVSALCGFSQE